MTVLEVPVANDIEQQINARRVGKLVDMPPQSEPWLRARKLGVGGSDVAAICGLNDWKSAFETYLDKVGDHPDGLSIPDNDKMKWGRLLEDPVSDETARRTGCVHVKPSYLFQHRDIDWALVNPDRIVIDPTRPDPGVLEIKTCAQWMGEKWGPDGSDSPATYAVFQAVHAMDVLDVQWADVAVLIGGQDHRCYRIERDMELVEMMRAYVADFWDRVLRRDPPPVTGAASDTDLLQRLFDAVEGKSVLLGDDAEQLVSDYNVAHRALKAAEEAKSLAGNQLRQMLGDGEIGVNAQGNQIVTWKQHETTAFDEKRFKADMPRFSATYTSKVPQRTLRPKKGI